MDAPKAVTLLGLLEETSKLTKDLPDPHGSNSYCRVCKKYFVSQYKYRNHLLQIHHMNLASLFPDVNQPTNTCTACQKQHPTQIKLHHHLMRSHNMNSDFTFKDCSTYCRLCERFYKNLNSYTVHCFRIHKNGSAKDGFSVYDIAVIAKRVHNRYECLNCGSYIRNIGRLSSHVCTKKQVKTSHPCTLCPKTYIKKTRLDAHIQSAHSKPTSNIIAPNCTLQSPEFYTSRNIMTLLESANPAVEYQLILESGSSSSNGSSPVTPHPSLQSNEKSNTKKGEYDFDSFLDYDLFLSYDPINETFS